jgi:hypothetical protein
MNASLEGRCMTGWVILVDHAKDMPNADTPHKVITASCILLDLTCSMKSGDQN